MSFDPYDTISRGQGVRPLCDSLAGPFEAGNPDRGLCLFVTLQFVALFDSCYHEDA